MSCSCVQTWHGAAKLGGQDQVRPDKRVEVGGILSVSLELSCLGVPVGHDIEISDKEADMEE